MSGLHYCLFLSQLIAFANGIKCYHCNSSVVDACSKGLNSVPSIECTSEEVCATYQYDVHLNGKAIGTSTSRGCEKDKNYCGTIEDLINILITPGVVKERKCSLCNKDLCNSSSYVHLSFFVGISVCLINFNILRYSCIFL
ncbi:uncharacterized protein LOC123317091 [Coccinella septempunctata]|uniref:uncharacterized protein LOC123317091 n=1 Tax=Coccinella septempunctata TaxID=41139 RepID=UPI001D07B958|nr:uncharacterized protein LOC123317091 [Coccinella septempunctata]